MTHLWRLHAVCSLLACVLLAGPASATGQQSEGGVRDDGAIRELEEASWRFAEEAESFRRDVLDYLRREIDRRRKSIQMSWRLESGRLDAEARLRRHEAIVAMESFLKRHPDHPRYTPEILFRLAKLYFDDTQDVYLTALGTYDEQQELYRKGRIPDSPVEPTRDFSRSIQLHESLLDRFPGYARSDEVLYSLGFTLRLSGEDDRALAAFERLISSHPGSSWVPEAWLLVGEHHFDIGDYARAAEAYRRALASKDSRYFGISLYKLAWSHFQMYDYPTAIRTFKDLIEYIDQTGAGDARAANVRTEAIDYLALSLADEDWDGDGLPDPEATVARALGYLQDGKPFEREILERYGDALYNEFEMRKFPMAIEAYRAVIDREPLNPGNAVIKEKIIAVFDTMRDTEASIRERADMVGAFGPGSPWYEANRNHPEVLARVDRRLELALNQVAQFHHRRAQELKAQSARTGDEQFLVAALQEYRAAAAAYADYLRRFPDNRYAYENAYSYADCLYFSFDFARAADVYRRVRDWPLKNTYLEPSAFNVIDALEKEAAKQVQDGRLEARDQPGEIAEIGEESMPQVEGKVRLEARPIAPIVQQWIADVQVYLDRGLSRPKDPELPARLAYRVAAEYYKQRHLDEARKRFEEILIKYPTSSVASFAAVSIINSFRLENDWSAIATWARRIEDLKVGRPEERAALAEDVRLYQLGARFKEAEQLFETGEFGAAAEAFEAVVDSDPKNRLADKALQNAALAWKQAKRYEAAARVYERIVSEYKTSPFVEGALLEIAENSRKVFDFERSARTFQALAERFPKGERAAYADFQASILTEASGNTRDAARSFEAFAARYPDDPEAGLALYRAGILYQRLGEVGTATRAYRKFIKEFGGETALGDKVVEAFSRIGDMARTDGNRREADAASQAVIREFEARGLQPDNPVAAFPARARFEQIESKFERYVAIEFKGTLKNQGKLLQDKARLLQELEQEYRSVLAYRSMEWTSAAYFRLAQIHELFARALFAAEIPEMSEDEMDIYQTAIEDRAKGFQDAAQERYETLVQEGRRLRIANDWTRKALESLNRYRPQEYPLVKEERRVMDFQVRRVPAFEEAM
jgi:TolA-binding protein